MIRAEEALRLPSAQLTDDEKTRADAQEREIEAAVLKAMGRNGVDLQIAERNPRVIAELNQRFKRAGWVANWRQIVETHRLNKALQEIVGYSLTLAPTDEAYNVADTVSSTLPA